MSDTLTEWPADDAPLSEWLRPVSASLESKRLQADLNARNFTKGLAQVHACAASRLRKKLRGARNA